MVIYDISHFKKLKNRMTIQFLLLQITNIEQILNEKYTKYRETLQENKKLFQKST